MSPEQKLKKLIKEQVREILMESKMPQAIKRLEWNINNALKVEGFKKVDKKDISLIAAAWLEATMNSGYVGETIPEDIYVNETINKILKKYGLE